jgi:hypothetical protein
MSTGQHTPLSHFRQTLQGLPKHHSQLVLSFVDQILRIIRGAPEDKKVLLKSPMAQVRTLLGALPEQTLGLAIERFDVVVQEAQEEARKRGLARTKDAYRSKAREAAKAREDALEEAGREIRALRYALKCLTGPGHVPPSGATTFMSNVARPAIKVSYWEDEPWTCLRLEERTIGHHREEAYTHPATGRPALRFNPETEKWMRWTRGIAQELKIIPAAGHIREVFFPGLVYTFMAWMDVPDRPVQLLHPMDNDNLVKATLDAHQTAPYKGEMVEYGVYQNDTQVVDLLIYRLPQDGAPPVDRITLGMEARKARKARKAAKAAAEPATEG